MKDISIADWIQIAILASGIITAVLSMVNRNAVANKRDKLASYTSAAANLASRINQIVSALPPGATAAAVKSDLIKQGADALIAEFGKQAPASATALKTEGIILGQYGQLPNAALVGDPADAKLVAAVVAKLNGDVVVTPVEDTTHG